MYVSFILFHILYLSGQIKSINQSVVFSQVHRCKIHVKFIIPRITVIADFEQRWRQRGKTTDCSFKGAFHFY